MKATDVAITTRRFSYVEAGAIDALGKGNNTDLEDGRKRPNVATWRSNGLVNETVLKNRAAE